MELRSHPTVSQGLVVQYRDTFNPRFEPSYIIDVTRNSVTVINAKIYNLNHAMEFSKAMNHAMKQLAHLSTSQTMLGV